MELQGNGLLHCLVNINVAFVKAHKSAILKMTLRMLRSRDDESC